MEHSDARRPIYGRQKPYLAKLLAEGTNTSPIGSHWQGAARLAQGLLGGLELGRQDASQAAMDKGFADLLRGAQGGSEQPPPTSYGMPAAAPAPRPAPPIQTSATPSMPKVIGDEEGIRMGIYDRAPGGGAAVQPDAANATFGQRFQPPPPAGATPVQSVPQAPQVTQFGRPRIDPQTAAIAGLLYKGGHGAEALNCLCPEN